jgi:hypothetical protein
MSKKDREAEGWTPEQLKQLADVPVPVPPSTDTVAALDVALDAFRAHYAAASPRFRQEAVAYIYLGIGRFELEAMRGPRRD